MSHISDLNAPKSVVVGSSKPVICKYYIWTNYRPLLLLHMSDQLLDFRRIMILEEFVKVSEREELMVLPYETWEHHLCDETSIALLSILLRRCCFAVLWQEARHLPDASGHKELEDFARVDVWAYNLEVS